VLPSACAAWCWLPFGVGLARLAWRWLLLLGWCWLVWLLCFFGFWYLTNYSNGGIVISCSVHPPPPLLSCLAAPALCLVRLPLSSARSLRLSSPLVALCLSAALPALIRRWCLLRSPWALLPGCACFAWARLRALVSGPGLRRSPCSALLLLLGRRLPGLLVVALLSPSVLAFCVAPWPPWPGAAPLCFSWRPPLLLALSVWRPLPSLPACRSSPSRVVLPALPLRLLVSLVPGCLARSLVFPAGRGLPPLSSRSSNPPIK
jgi:hypothetical protein